jgi:ABC-type Fe3+ transport system substrate-binding protein
LTEKIPLENPTEPRKNLVKYNYFAISKTTPNPTAALKFIEYLLTADAEKRFLQNNAHLVAAQREFWSAQQGTKISTILSRASMDAFIPDTDEDLSVFSY